MKALPLARAKAPRLLLYNTPLPRHNPTPNSLNALAMKVLFSTAPPAADVAASLLINSIAGLPSRPNVSTDIGTGIAFGVDALVPYRLCRISNGRSTAYSPRRLQIGGSSWMNDRDVHGGHT